jgi:UDP-N-acetylmuramoyl-L-alanyl-D-glutamate--2,6-diaminopimelate ligase
MAEPREGRRQHVILAELLRDLPTSTVSGDLDQDVSSVVVDARAARPGSMFVYLPVPLSGGNNDVAEAIGRGATAVLSEPGLCATGAAHILVPDIGVGLGTVMSAFCGHPSRSLTVMAVTGTNGKTSVSWLLRHILRSVGYICGLISTVGAGLGDQLELTGFTTPPSCALQPLLARMLAAGATHVSLEASSHGLAQERFVGTRVVVGGMTNLSRDHLDFHQTMDAYADAKAILFQRFAERACFNVGDPVAAHLFHEFTGEKLSTAVAPARANLVLDPVELSMSGTLVEVTFHSVRARTVLPLPGRHNIENAAVALGMAILAGVAFEDGVAALETADAPPGRLQQVGASPCVMVDFAHSPDALHHVLTTVRSLTRGQLICVFGASGDSDRGKRPLMGTVVRGLVDRAFVTSGNPRTEDPNAIIREILAGMVGGKCVITIEPDRRLAIERALLEARPEDTVVVAGKGHQTYQEIGGVSHPFDDAEVCREVLRRRIEYLD